MIKFEEIHFCNFLSFYGEHSFTFSSKGIHHIEGFNLDEIEIEKVGEDEQEKTVSIGSGKTSFTFVIQYALFGVISKKLDKKDKIINKKVKKNLKVQLVFKIDDNRYRISRYRKHNEYNNDLYFEIYSNKEKKWSDLTETSTEATQSYINEIIGISPETFLKTILYSREDEKQFFKLTQSERIKIIENIIQLNKFNKYLKKIKSKIKKNNEELIETEKEETATEKAIKIHQNNADQEKKDIDNQTKFIEKNLKELKALNENLDINKFQEYKDKLSVLKRKKREAKNEKVEVADPSRYEKEIKRLNKKEETIADKLKNLSAIVCIKCGATQNEEEFNKIFHEYLAEKKEIISQIKEEQKELDIILKEIPIQEKTNEVKDGIIKEIQEQITFFEDELEENFSSILDKTEEEIEEIKQKQDLINQYERDLSKLNYNKVEEHLKKVNKEDKKLKKIKEKKEVLNKNKKMLSWWEEVLDMKNENSIKSFIISQIIPVLNNILKNNLNIIFNGNLSIYIDNSLKEKIYKNDTEYDYAELSSGEKLKVNFSTNFSIFDMTKINLTSSNLIFFDDVFINIDLPTTLKFLDLIKSKYANNAAVYLISHDKNVINNITPLTHTIIKKKNDISYIE